MDRDGQSFAPERQEEACRALAARNGWTVVEVYSDRNKSAFRKGVVRPEYERLREDIASRKVNAVLIWKLDRLSRTVKEFTSFYDFAEDYGCELASVTDNIDTTTAQGKAMVQMASVMAEMEAANTGDRVRVAEMHRARRGLPHGGGHRSFGYDRTTTSVVESEAKEIRAMAERLRAGASLWEIATDLNDRGVLTTAGGTWTTNSLSQMLRSPKLRAVRVYQGESFEGTWPAILTQDEQVEVMTLLSQGWSGKSRSLPKYAHMLSGLIKCGRCHASLRWNKGRLRGGGEHPKYQCTKEPGKTARHCGALSIDQVRVEELVTGVLLAHIRESASTGAPELDQVEVEDLRTQLLEDREARKDLAAARFVEQVLDHATYLSTLERLDERIDDAEAQLAHLTRRSRLDFGTDIESWWDMATIEDKRRILRLFIDRILVHPVGKGGRVFRPERVQIIWVE